MNQTSGFANSSLDVDCSASYLYPYWIHTFFPPCIYTISALGIGLNLLVLLVFLLHKKPCTATEIYLSNMAAADVLLCVFLPLWGKSTADGFNWTFGDSMCKIVYLLITMNYSCSIFFLVLVCVDRFMALAHPLSDCKLRRRKYAKISCAVMWGAGLLLNIPILACREAAYYGVHEGAEVHVCYWNCSDNAFVAHSVALAVVSFSVPLVVITFCTAKILQALRERPSEGVSKQTTERKVTVLVLAVLLAFLICWLPCRVQKMLDLAMRLGSITVTCELARVNNVSDFFFLSLGFFNSSLNPVLYVMVGKAFRNKMWEVLFRGRKTRKSSTQLTYNTASTSISSSQKVQVNANRGK